MSGVKRVENELQVVASAKQDAGTVRDDELERAVPAYPVDDDLRFATTGH